MEFRSGDHVVHSDYGVRQHRASGGPADRRKSNATVLRPGVWPDDGLVARAGQSGRRRYAWSQTLKILIITVLC